MKYAYINSRILNGQSDMTPTEGLVIITTGDRIESIQKKGCDLSGCTVIDLEGKYIMPGLINMHVHLPASGKPKKKPTDAKKTVKLMTSCAPLKKLLVSMCGSFAKTELYSGVTTIRTVGGVQDCDTTIRDSINSGRSVGPRILASNMAVSVPDGHMAGSLAYVATSAEEAAKYVRVIMNDKPDLIKLMITGGVLDAKEKGEPGVLKMPPEYVKAACEEAHRAGLKVAAHVESPEGVRVALENGVDTIEHGASPDAQTIELFKKHGAAFIATISPALPFALFDRSVSNVSEMAQFNGKVVFDGGIACAKACLEAGVPVGLGTDTGCPFITHYDMWREINYFAKYCGVSNAFALSTATLGNARIAGISDIAGSIEEGKCADFVVTERNPLEDLTALRDVSIVVAGGKPIMSPRVKKMKQVEEQLDKFI